jgi:hypothetical protein
LARFESLREMKLVWNAIPHRSEYLVQVEKIMNDYINVFQRGSGWERLTSDISQANTTGRAGEKWKSPGGEVAILMVVAKVKTLAQYCLMRN